MELERRNQVETAHECDHGHEAPERESEADGQQSFTGEGAIPAVESEAEHEHDVVRPPPSASERAFGSTRGAVRPAAARAAGGGVLNQQVTRNIFGINVIAPAGVQTGAIDEVAAIIGLEVGRNLHAQKKLAEAQTSVVIIPARTQMTDMPQFAGLRGKETFDGRDWSKVRGSGGMRAPDGSFAIGVAEENLVAVRGVVSHYAPGYSIAMHEIAHAVESKGLTDEQEGQLVNLYEERQQADRRDRNTHHEAFTDTYASQNKHEYFAQSTNAFFNRNAGSEGSGRRRVQNHNGRDWLRLNDPKMYAFLVDLYETNRDADGRRVA